jgi:hypothetical protein
MEGTLDAFMIVIMGGREDRWQEGKMCRHKYAVLIQNQTIYHRPWSSECASLNLGTQMGQFLIAVRSLLDVI